MVAEGDLEVRKAQCMALSKHGFAVFSVKSGNGAEEAVQTLLPDAVLLSLALPVRDGFAVLETIGRKHLKRYPYIVVGTQMGEYTRAKALKLGADAALEKPIAIHAFADLIGRLQSAGFSMLAFRHATKRVESIRQSLREIGMPENLKGFGYLAQAIAYVSVDDRLLKQATRALYPRIAKDYGVTDHSVERAIRHAIETTWTRGHAETLNRVFQNSIDPQRGKPTNTECIAMFTEKLHEQKLWGA